jgi:uncharacterized protein involved in copper resistance
MDADAMVVESPGLVHCFRKRGDGPRVSRRGAVGIEGLAPHFFQFQPTFYFRDGGNVAGRLEGPYDLLITQRLVVQPEAELNFYSKSDPGRGTGSGLSDLDSGIRLRYAISRKVAPYAPLEPKPNPAFRINASRE